jgi:hypothetical protein
MPIQGKTALARQMGVPSGEILASDIGIGCHH